MRRWRTLWLVSAIVAGCSAASSTPTGTDGGSDAGGPPNTTPDASTAGDASTVTGMDSGADACATADLMTDPRSCGACNHDCLGGSCSAGVCRPFRVSRADASASSIASNGNGVFWVTKSGSQVLSCPTAGCPSAPAVLAGSLNNTVALVAVGADLAVLDDNDLQNVTTPAGASTLIYPRVGTVSNGQAICGDDTPYVYYEMTSGNPFITRTRVDGGDLYPGAYAQTSGLNALGCGAGHVLWYVSSGTDTIYSCQNATDCGVPATILPASNGGETHIAATTGLAFFTRRQTGTLNSCAITGCATPTVLHTTPDLNGVAADDTYVYFTSGTGGLVGRCPHAGCGGNPTVLASNQTNPHALLVTKDAVYWATDALPAGGADAGTPPAIWRVMK